MRPPVTSYSGLASRVLASVDLPEPFGPMMACTSPGWTTRSTPFRRSAGGLDGAGPQALDPEQLGDRFVLLTHTDSLITTTRHSGKYRPDVTRGPGVFLPGAEPLVALAAGADPVAGAVREEAERVLAGRGRRRRRPGSGRRRRWPGRPATAASAPIRRLYVATGRPGRSSPAASSSGGASTQAVAGMLRSRSGVGGRSAVWTGVSSIGRWSAGRATVTSPGRSTPGGGAARCRSWCRGRGRAARWCRRAGRTGAPRSTG